MMKRLIHLGTVTVLLIGLLLGLLAPVRHTSAASSGSAAARAMTRQEVDRQTVAPPSDLANVPGASADWWVAVQQQIQQDRFTLSEVEAKGGPRSYVAHNPVHGFDLTFPAGGVHLVPAGDRAAAGGEAAWSWGLRLTAYGYDGHMQPLVAPPEMTANGTQLAYRHAGLTEWYINDERGLEQGFVLEAPPPAGRAGQALVLEMALETGLVLVLSDDAQSIDFLQSAGSVAVLHYTDLGVVDATGRELAAQLSVSPGRIAIAIDDAGAAYPLLVDPVVITPEWTVEGNQADDQLGFSVATAGDVNGDGYDDVIVGVPGHDADYDPDAGRADVYYGSASGLSLSPDWTVEGNWEDTRFGASVATAGDVNDDGYDDVIVGAPGRSYVYVYLGSASGLSASPVWEKSVDPATEPQFGSVVGTAGDVDWDGHDDIFIVAPGSGHVQVFRGYYTGGLIDTVYWSALGVTAAATNPGGPSSLLIGRPDYTNGQQGEGEVVLYAGSSSGLATTSKWHYESNVAGAHLGASVVAAGGMAIIGAPGYTNGQQGEGRAFAFLPTDSALVDPPFWTAESDQADAAFGTSVGIADVNGDGRNDVVVGAPGYDSVQSDEGRVFVYYGSVTGLSFLPQFTAESSQEDAAFGQAVGSVGDVNGDGYDDVIAGAPGFDTVALNEGRAYVFLGSAPVITAHQWSAEGEAASDELGRSVATAGDVNGDGYSDVVVSAPYSDEAAGGAGKVTVYYGSGSGLGLEPSWAALGEAAQDGFGTVAGTAGDLNGDGYDDLVVGAPGHGGGRVYVYYGSGAGLGVSGWVASGQYAGDEFGNAVGTAGDVNRDGYDDLVIGAAGYPDGNAYGKVYVYHGAADGLGSTPAWTASGKSAGERLGADVGTAGDANGDGYADVIIGVPARSQVHVYHGGPEGLAPGAANWTATGDAGSQFGHAIGTTGDVNGDGYSDIVIGAPLLDPAGMADAGRAYVYYGAVGGLSSSPNWTVDGAAAGNRLGAAVGTAGDTDGDGYADLVIGVYGSDSLAGQIRLYQGSSGGLGLGRTIAGEAAADRLGLAVGAAGDVNGDGFGDIIAGAPGYDGPGGANGGRASVYHGSATVPGGDWGPQGKVARAAGDVNGDSFSDVIVYDRTTPSGTVINAAYVYYGSGAGLSQEWQWRSTTDFPLTVGTAGDVSGDGYADVFLSDADTVRVYHGSATGLAPSDYPYHPTPDWSAAICGDAGCAVGTAGDVNADGYSDLIVGRKSANEARVYYGSPTGLALEAGWTTTGSGGYGGAVGTAGDVNGDGYADVVVAADSAVYAYYGSIDGLTSGAPDLTFTAAGTSSYPCTVATAGDVDGDGYADVVVGAPYTNNRVGKVYLFYGSPSGLDAPLGEFMGGAVGDEFGTSVATAGDVNGDGYADVLVGAPKFEYNNRGRAYLYYGGSVGLEADQQPWAYTQINYNDFYFGFQVGAAGDIDGDGYGDVLISNNAGTGIAPVVSVLRGNGGGGRTALPRQTRGDGSRIPVQPWGRATRDSFSVTLRAIHPLGRGLARLQVQACPPGVPFGDVSCRDYTADEGREIADAAGVDLKQMAEALEEDTLYRWRARLLYDSPFVPHGPWHRFLGQGQEADVRAGRLATDLQITKTMLPTGELTLPAQITYTLNYTSAGGPAAGVVITDLLPAGLDNVQVTSSGPAIQDTGVQPVYVWWVGDMAAGEHGQIIITAEANATRFVNIAEIGGTSHDVNPQNNLAMVQTRIPGVIYVDADAQGADDGTTWVDAFTDLQDALADAASGDQIWVAEGVYKPTSGVARTATFSLAANVSIYGGFVGDEAYLHERGWRAHPTVLNGDIGTLNNDDDDIYHVVTAKGVDSTAVLDGFVITGGRATGVNADARGAGILIDSASPTLRSISLLDNSADQGGAIYSTGGTPTLVNLVLSGNSATAGGGMYVEAGSPALINVTFSQNTATQGGALYDADAASLTNCIVWDEDPMQSLIAGAGATTVTYSDVRGGAAGTGNINADPQFMDATGADGIAGTLDDDLRIHTTFRFPSPVIDQGLNSALPADTDDLDGDGDVSEAVPLDVTARARLIGFTALPPTVDMGALEANIEDVLAGGDAMLAEGTSFRMEHLQLLPTDTPELAMQNYSNFNDGEWYYAFCSDYDNLDTYGYCPVDQSDHVRNDLLDAVDLYRVAATIWPTATWTTRAGEVIEVWQRGGRGVVGSAVEIGNDHLIFGAEYLVDATDYRFSTAGLPYADQIISQELNELAQAARQFELVMDLVFRAFSEWRVGDYCTSDEFETFGVTSSLLMSALDEMASRYYMMNKSAKAREVYVAASRNQMMHLAALADLAEETGHAYLVNGSWEMLNNVSRMRERARQIDAGFDFFGFRPDYAPLQPYDQLLELTEGPGGGTGLLGTARDLEDQARNAQRDYDTNATEMATELDEYRFEIDEKLFDLCGETEDLDGDGYGDYRTCEGGQMAKNWEEFQEAYIRRALAWNKAQNIARQIQTEQERADQVINVILGAGREIAAADLAIGKLEAEKTTTTKATASESSVTTGAEASVEAWMEAGFKVSSNIANNEAFVQGGLKVSLSTKLGGEWKDSQTDTTQTEWDPNAAKIGSWEGLKDLMEAEKDADIEGANSAATIKNLLLQQSESLEEWEIATAELNQVAIEHNHLVETWSRLRNMYAEASPTVMTYNSHLLNPAYRLWRDSLTIQSSQAHALAAQFAYLTARASEYELLTPFPNLGDAYKTRTANDIRMFLDDLKVWHQALDLPGQLNRYPYTLSVAQDFLSLTDEQLDPDGLLTPEELSEERYDQLQEAFASRIFDGDLELVFSTSLDQQRPGGHFVFSPNIWNNRIAAIGSPLASNVGVRVNIITTEPVDAGVVEVILVHDGQATYRNSSAQNVVYDPATAVPVGYLIPAELSPANTTVVVRPDINGQGGLPNSGLVNLSVAASHWKLRIPAHSWGNLDVSQIQDIEIVLDTTGRALPDRTAEAADDATRLADGMEMAVPSEAWLRELRTSQKEAPDLTSRLTAESLPAISAVAIPGQVSGSYYGNLVVTSPITIAVMELDFDVENVDGALIGVVDVTDSALASQPISLTGTATGDQFILVSNPFTNVVNGRVVTQAFTLVGHAEEDADILWAVYTGTITNLLPETIVVEGQFVASRPSAVAGNGLLMETGTWQVPTEDSTPITVTLVNGLMQPITGTGTITFATDIGAVVPSTVDMVDGVAFATFEAGTDLGETVVVATTGEMTGRVRIQIVANAGTIADAGPDQEVEPGATVTLDGSGSSDPSGDPLTYLWEQTGGEAVSFTPALSMTTFTAPLSPGPLTFNLTVTGTTSPAGSDVTVVTVRNVGPTAIAGPGQQVEPGAIVTLDGSASSDPNGDALTYHWVQTGGEAVSFSPAVSITTFTAPATLGSFTFALTVTDTGGLSATDTVVITASHLLPVADAGPDQQVGPGATVTLDGSGSSDPNGDPLTYLWVQTGGVEVGFSPAVSVTTFVAPSGLLTFTLIVTNTAGLTASDTTVVTVTKVRIYLPLILSGSPQAQLAPDQGSGAYRDCAAQGHRAWVLRWRATASPLHPISVAERAPTPLFKKLDESVIEEEVTSI